MAEEIKNNDHILSNKEAFMQSYERARLLFGKMEGVVGVGFGQKAKDNSFLPDICIIVFVKQKKDISDIPPDQLIPKFFEGYPTDVFIVGSGKPLVCTGGDATYENMLGGIQIATGTTRTIPDPSRPGQQMLEIDQSLGTMACIVRKRGDTSRDNVYLLSNRHVLYSKVGANDYVYHPYIGGDPSRDSTGLGPIHSLAFYDNVIYPAGGTTDYFIDCAIARINIDCFCWGTRCTKDTIKHKPGKIVHRNDANVVAEINITDVRDAITDPAVINAKVFKYGSVTRKTTGFIRQVNVPADILRPDGTVEANARNTISIEFDATSTSNGLNCNNRPSFAEEGDSGSLVIDEQGRAVGLLFLGPVATVPNPVPANFYFCHACHILPVLDNMRICIPVTGPATTYGTCAAIDGSGQTPAPSPGTGGGGGALRMSEGVASDSTSPETPAFLQADPITEEQQERLTGLLAVFRSTNKGRELHGAFALIRRELGYLVRNCRPVTVAWYRNKGPAFFASMLNHLRGDPVPFLHQVGNARLDVLMDKMEEVLLKHGSNPLRRILEEQGNDIKSMLLSGNDVQDFMDYLRKTEPI